MGWTTCYNVTTPRQARDEFIRGLGPSVEVLADGPGTHITAIGREVYSRWWFALRSPEYPEGLIVARVMEDVPKHGLRCKDVSEHEHPYYYDVPANVWEAVPSPKYSKESHEWTKLVQPYFELQRDITPPTPPEETSEV